jgi:hypothetical protein
MKMSITYVDSCWVFEVASTGDEPSYYDGFEIDDLDEAIETAADLLKQIRSAEDPLADLFDEED